jgi:hypothetical protein
MIAPLLLRRRRRKPNNPFLFNAKVPLQLHNIRELKKLENQLYSLNRYTHHQITQKSLF